MPEVTETLYVTETAAWRKWLAKNYDKKSEIWLIFPKSASGKNRISYNDAVEQALCFGWIDSIQKSFDEDSTVQRFTPRKNQRDFSQPNIERLHYLAKTKQLMPFVADMVKPFLDKEFVFPKDIINAIQKNSAAYKHFQAASPPYKRMRVAYVDGARKRPEEFKKRLANLITALERNKQLGYGGIEKYY
jgi:uncharacterized protein YdeI (YjbR/CyaY-like superfamily)